MKSAGFPTEIRRFFFGKTNNLLYLEKVPCRKENIVWNTDERGIVTLEIENKGIMNRIFQLILKKPRVSYIHLDETGSFLWPQIDGEANIIELGKRLKEKFGDEAEPLYDRLGKFFGILERKRTFAVSYNLIGKRKPATYVCRHFLCLNKLSLRIRGYNPVWNCNGTTAYEVYDSGKCSHFPCA